MREPPCQGSVVRKLITLDNSSRKSTVSVACADSGARPSRQMSPHPASQFGIPADGFHLGKFYDHLSLTFRFNSSISVLSAIISRPISSILFLTPCRA